MSSVIKALVLGATLLLASLPCVAQTGDEFGEDIFSPEERAKLELKRRREARPVLACSPGTLKAAVEKGSTETLRLTVMNAGGSTLDWKVKLRTRMLRLDASSGSLGFEQKRLVKVTVDSAGLEVGTVRGRIILEAAGAKGSPLEVPVVVTVRPAAKPVTRPSEDVKPDVGEPGGGPEPVGPGARELNGFGVRLGYISPGGGDEEDFSGAMTYGLYYRPGSAESRLGFEFGLDLGSSDSESGTAEAGLVMVSVAALYRMNGGKSFYLLGGGKIVSEKVEDGTFGTDDSTLGGTLDFGAGTVLAQGRVDVRATYSILLGSDNVPGAASLLVGYSF